MIEEKYEARKALGKISYFLEINIMRNYEGNIQMKRYIQELLDRNEGDCKSVEQHALR